MLIADINCNINWKRRNVRHVQTQKDRWK